MNLEQVLQPLDDYVKEDARKAFNEGSYEHLKDNYYCIRLNYTDKKKSFLIRFEMQ